ncbi:hypothetical protein NP233_g5268 [Leucocoprinus birnbaumii]|uniref:Uncharacterized protein n=1 Tax=Leucocoprinus birnbaumii TaxID=56174 RepID=A0AAD5VT69_9AGAR|nr:hypothetical protein NP233_g5268 [Leucocoprinus birnbaumii]
MASSLEFLPSDILHQIAHQATKNSFPALGTRQILSLLLTSSTLYQTLNLKSCPHLYADIFRSSFDTYALLKRFKFQVTDSVLANELVVRCQMLRRIRRHNSSSSALRDDLWTALWMVYESDGRNEFHLGDACLPEYLLGLLKRWDHDAENTSQELRSLVIWLLCFTLKQQHIWSLVPDAKATLHRLLLPYSRNSPAHAPVVSINNFSPPSAARVHSRDRSITRTQVTQDRALQSEFRLQHQRRFKHGIEPIDRYGRKWVPNCPDPTSAAINLLFSLKETEQLAIPQHLPETRLIALATQRSGPTQEDVRKIRGYKTTLFADMISPGCQCPNRGSDSQYLDGKRSQGMDLEFQRTVWGEEGVKEVKALSVTCGTMSGVWEGFFMQIAPFSGLPGPTPGDASDEEQEPHHEPQDFICRKPMQSMLVEYVCYADSCPKSSVTGDVSELKDLPKLCLETQDGFELDGRKYERFAENSEEGSPEEEIREPVDIVLLGETIQDHDQAWGGFRFAGRVRKDGSIILKREAKEDGADAFAGTWNFEGKLHFGTVFVGTCAPSTSTPNTSPAIRSIFSMQKRAKGFTSW